MFWIFSCSIEQIYKVDQLYDWLTGVLIPGLRAKRWYNDDPPVFQRGFIITRTDRIIGYALLRQVRSKPSMSMKTIIKKWLIFI